MIPWIGLASGLGGSDAGSGEGPLFLNERLSSDFQCQSIVLPNQEIKDTLAAIAFSNAQLAQAAFDLTKKESFFVSIGGDHSSGIGIWSGVATALRSKGDIGLIWFDAHMDSHTLETSESGNIHGMPVAALLGYGDPNLTHISDPLPKVKPENLVLIGIRSFEAGEEALLKRLNVRIYLMDEVASRGIDVVMKEAIEIVSRHTVGYGLSFDLDGIDPSFVSAVGTPVPNGVHPEELLSCFSLLQQYPPLAFELVEYNPSLDKNLETFRFIERLMESIKLVKFSVV